MDGFPSLVALILRHCHQSAQQFLKFNTSLEFNCTIKMSPTLILDIVIHQLYSIDTNRKVSTSNVDTRHHPCKSLHPQSPLWVRHCHLSLLITVILLIQQPQPYLISEESEKKRNYLSGFELDPRYDRLIFRARCHWISSHPISRAAKPYPRGTEK